MAEISSKRGYIELSRGQRLCLELLSLDASLRSLGYQIFQTRGGQILFNDHDEQDRPTTQEYFVLRTVREYAQGPLCRRIDVEEFSDKVLFLGWLMSTIYAAALELDEARIKARNMVAGWPLGRSCMNMGNNATLGWPRGWKHSREYLSDLAGEKAEERRKAAMMAAYYADQMAGLMPAPTNSAMRVHAHGYAGWFSPIALQFFLERLKICGLEWATLSLSPQYCHCCPGGYHCG